MSVGAFKKAFEEPYTSMFVTTHSKIIEFFSFCSNFSQTILSQSTTEQGSNCPTVQKLLPRNSGFVFILLPPRNTLYIVCLCFCDMGPEKRFDVPRSTRSIVSVVMVVVPPVTVPWLSSQVMMSLSSIDVAQREYIQRRRKTEMWTSSYTLMENSRLVLSFESWLAR